MDVREIPGLLLNEFGVDIETISERHRIARTEHGHWFRCYEDHPLTILKIYVSKAALDENRREEIAELRAGPHEIGVWSAGRGKKQRETVSFRLTADSYELPQHAPTFALFGKLALRASELLASGIFDQSTHWQGEVELNPMRGQFDRP